MVYFIEIRFEDPGYNAIVHFLSTYAVNDDREAAKLCSELLAAIRRQGGIFISSTSYRIDHDPQLVARTHQYSIFFQTIATASIEISQFRFESPDQTQSLIDNLMNKFYNGESSIAEVGRKYNIPARVKDKTSKNPIGGELYYFHLEHLIPIE